MDERTWWGTNGYLAGKEIGDGMWVCLARMIYTFRLMICDPGSVYEFYCYPSLDDATAAYDAWDGVGDPLPGWVKHHPSGQRRAV